MHKRASRQRTMGVMSLRIVLAIVLLYNSVRLSSGGTVDSGPVVSALAQQCPLFIAWADETSSSSRAAMPPLHCLG